MLRTYSFFCDGENRALEFDDTRSVRELIAYAFEQFGYYEPAGMEIVTLFQSGHPETSCGWITTETDRSCAEEIVNRDWLCFAYYLPGKFYFAEGGWGHHMPDLGNHPELPEAFSLKLIFEDFKHTVVLNGNLCFADIVAYLRETGYLPDGCSRLRVYTDVNNYRDLPYDSPLSTFTIPFSDKRMQLSLREFRDMAEKHIKEQLPDSGFVYFRSVSIE